MADYLNFQNIYQAVERAVKQDTGVRVDLIKNIVNMVYLNEVLEADDLYPLFWLVDFDDSLSAKEPAETITGITAADPPVVSDATHTFVVGDIVTMHDISGMTELNGRMFYVGAIVAGTSYSLYDLDGNTIDGSGYTAWTSGGKALHAGVKLATSNKNVKDVLEAGWRDYSGLMDPATIKEIEEVTTFFGQTDSESSTRPQKYMHSKRFSSAGAETNLLIWGPGADQDYDLRYWYIKRAARLSADADVPLLPPQFHDTIISGAVTRLAENDVQVENAVIWPGIYRLQLENLRTYNRKYYQEHPEHERKKPYML